MVTQVMIIWHIIHEVIIGYNNILFDYNIVSVEYKLFNFQK